MARSNRSLSATPSQRPSRIPQLLLYGLAIALICCILGGGILYLYNAFNNVVSSYRRGMNAAAYNAQVYVDQREAVLRWVTASLLQVNGDTDPQSIASAKLKPLPFIPIMTAGGRADWVLALTSREKKYLRSLNLRILHTSQASGETRYLDSPGHALPAPVQEWIAEFLSKQTLKPQVDDLQSPILWLRPRTDKLPRLFFYTLLDANNPSLGWIGIESDSAELLPQSVGHHTNMPNYLLLNPQQHIIVKNGVYLDPPLDFQERIKIIPGDDFRITWKDFQPNYLVLSKFIGEGGWRLIYYVRFADMRQHGDLPTYGVAATVLLLCMLVILSLRQIRAKLLIPAMRQYDALQESERLTRTIIAAAPVGLCLLDRQNATPFASNDIATHWLQRENPEWCKNALQHTIIGAERTLDDGRSVQLDFVPLSYRERDVVLCAVKDITAMKEVENSLRAAKHKADAANQAKSEFLAIMSHEIRTPLFGITGTLELLSLTALTPHQQQYLRTVQFSTTTLLSTINKTLSVPHAVAEYEQLQISDVSPVQLLNSVVASYADRAMAKGILLYGIVDCNTPDTVAGDELRIRRILNNLVNNAIKFTAYGQVVVRLRAQESTPDTTTLAFQVTDTGIGITPDAQKLLFSPYYQAKAEPESATTQPPDYGGTGLGLFICKRLADMMQGKLSATSAPGLGTSITFIVPLPVRSQDSTIRLQPDRVYVHGALQEIVLNLCAWLGRWGLLATPYQTGDEACADNALLLQAWPPHDIDIDWHGRQIIMLPPGQIPGEIATPGCWYSSTHDIGELRRMLALTQNKTPPAAQSTTQADAQPTSRGMQVLVIDDNAINRQILEEQLRKLGCTTIRASNGQQAMSLLQQHDVDLILTDINMPVMNGYMLAQHLRDQGCSIPIYGVTAMMLTTERDQAHAAGMTDLLPRPLSIAALSELLQHLDRRG